MLANVQQTTIRPIITAAVAPGTLVHTDKYAIYARLPAWLNLNSKRPISAPNGLQVVDLFR